MMGGEGWPIRLRRLGVRSGLYAPIKRLNDARWLSARRRRGTFSQFGEDRAILELVGSAGTYVDVGSNHPFKANTTYLLYDAGWHGLAIDPIRSHIDHHRRIRPRDVCVNAAAGRTPGVGLFHELNPDGFSTFDGLASKELIASGRAIEVARYRVPIVRVLDEWRARFGSTKPDLLSIDTEGFEIEVLDGSDLAALDPRYVLLELTSSTESRAELLVGVMASFGYELEAEFGVNGLFGRPLPRESERTGP
jgi:FkbM family methyltransferase